MNLFKSKHRVADHGEVFTPPWMVEAMLDLVKDETERIDARFLEPACGNGNFLTQILRRKLAAVERKYGRSDFERRHYALLALMCTYGIELLADNIAECRANMLEILAEYLHLEEADELFAPRPTSWPRTWCTVMRSRCAPTMTGPSPLRNGATWARASTNAATSASTLTLASSFSAQDSLFAHVSKHEIFTPTKTYPPLTVSELAALRPASAPQEAA